jgi:hypothetical protein
MARIILGSYVVPFPLGGYLSWVLQWLVGLERLGHEVYYFERVTGPDACYDPERGTMSDDCSYGVRALSAQLAEHGLSERWSVADYNGRHHGLSREKVRAVFASADLFIDMGAHGGWREASEQSDIRIYVDGEPGRTQIRLAEPRAEEEQLPDYDRYYTVGLCVGAPGCPTPTAGRDWHPIVYPVNTDLFHVRPVDLDAPFTTVTSWSAHDPITYRGVTYGAKDAEFDKFIDLPGLVSAPIELAVSGRDVPRDELLSRGWRLRSSQEVTMTIGHLLDYVAGSRGEFSLAKNVFVGLRTGWFGDRAGVYLASGRPVVMQDTGFGDRLPCGEGLFAVSSAEDAAAAIEAVCADHPRHARAARAIAEEHLEARRVLGGLLDDLGLAARRPVARSAR